MACVLTILSIMGLFGSKNVIVFSFDPLSCIFLNASFSSVFSPMALSSSIPIK